MSRYVALSDFVADWNNNRKGRRVQCPHCKTGFQAYTRILDARCGCGRPMKLLTGGTRLAPSPVAVQIANSRPVRRVSKKRPAKVRGRCVPSHKRDFSGAA